MKYFLVFYIKLLESRPWILESRPWILEPRPWILESRPWIDIIGRYYYIKNNNIGNTNNTQ